MRATRVKGSLTSGTSRSGCTGAVASRPENGYPSIPFHSTDEVPQRAKGKLPRLAEPFAGAMTGTTKSEGTKMQTHSWFGVLCATGTVLAFASVSACCKRGTQREENPSVGAVPATASAIHAPRGVTSGKMPANTSVVFLHHSTGENIWNGGVSGAIDAHNARAGTSYRVTPLAFPHDPYPWDNYPYDYWNIWVKNAGPSAYQGQETLEMLTRDHQVIVFKHCYPASAIEPDDGAGDLASSRKTLSNYKLQYQALKVKLRSFPSTRFIVWTGAALTKTAMREKHGGDDEMAGRAKQFFAWVRDSWDEPGDNVFVFDFFSLETEGGGYLLDRYAQDAWDSHPNESFARQAAPRFAQRIIDVIEGRGDQGR